MWLTIRVRVLFNSFLYNRYNRYWVIECTQWRNQILHCTTNHLCISLCSICVFSASEITWIFYSTWMQVDCHQRTQVLFHDWTPFLSTRQQPPYPLLELRLIGVRTFFVDDFHQRSLCKISFQQNSLICCHLCCVCIAFEITSLLSSRWN